MPRKGARLNKYEMWSLLQTVADNMAILSAQVDCIQNLVDSKHKADEEHARWGLKNTKILSARVPLPIATRWDEVMLCEGITTNSMLNALIEDFVDEYNPAEKGLFYVPSVPLHSDLVHQEEISADCPADNSTIVPRDKLLAEVKETLECASSRIDNCI